MGRVIDYLTREWVDGRLARHRRVADNDGVQVLRDELRRVRSRQALDRRFGEDEVKSRDLEMWGGVIEHLLEQEKSEEDIWNGRVHDCMERCELEYAAGADMAVIRKMCRDFIEALTPIIKAQDFSEKIDTRNGCSVAEAKEIVARFGGQWRRIDR